MKEDNILTRAKKAKDFWAPRTRKIKEWYRFARLVDELKEDSTGDVETMVSPTPRGFRMLSLHLLSSGKVRDRIPITTQEMADRDKGADCERAIHSIWREKDAEQIQAGEMLWRRQFYDFAFMTGWYSVFHGVFKEGKDPYFRADILNPANVFQTWVARKLVGCYHIYSLKEDEILLLAKAKGWKLKAKGTQFRGRKTIYTCWERDGDDIIYGVYIDDEPVVNPSIQKEFKSIPILTGPVGGFADRGTIKGEKEWIARVGESPFEPERESKLARDRMRSYLQQITKDIAQGTKYDITNTGEGAISPEDVGKIVHLKVGESMGQVSPDTSALPQLNYLFSQDTSEEGIVTIPPVAYGSTQGLELSGYAYNQMMTAAYSALGELHSVGDQARAMIDKNWLDDFKSKWPKSYKMKISGKEVGEHAGFFNKEFGPEDIPDFTYVDVEAPLAMPSDFLQRLTAARTAIPEGPLMDFVTAADELLKFDDPELVKRRIAEDEMSGSIYMRQARLVFQLRKRAGEEKEQGNEEFANTLLYMADRLIEQIGIQQGAPTPPKTGLRPEVSPPEMGGVSPQEERARR